MFLETDNEDMSKEKKLEKLKDIIKQNKILIYLIPFVFVLFLKVSLQEVAHEKLRKEIKTLGILNNLAIDELECKDKFLSKTELDLCYGHNRERKCVYY